MQQQEGKSHERGRTISGIASCLAGRTTQSQQPILDRVASRAGWRPDELGLSGELRGSKGQLYEGGIKQPLIAWGPGLLSTSAAGTVNDKTIVAGMDFSPSVLSIAHVAMPANAHPDGEDLSAAILGDATIERKSALMWVRPPDRPGPRNNFPDLAIRQGNWKLLVFRDASRPELFDIQSDPNESKNLAKSHADLVQRLSKTVIDWDQAISSHLKTQ